MWKCPKCGAHYSDFQHFCLTCDISRRDAAPDSESEQKLNKPPRRTQPPFNEVSLYGFAVGFLFIVLFYGPAHIWSSLKSTMIFIPSALVAGLIVIGMIYCLVHAFSHRRKSPFAVKVMLFSAVVSNFIIGFALLVGQLAPFAVIVLKKPAAGTTSLNYLFALFNFYSAYFLLQTLNDPDREEEIANHDASLLEIIVSTFLMFFVVLMSKEVLGVHWVGAFSCSLGFATSFNAQAASFINSEFNKLHS
jgi:hypothetical protein